MKQRVEEMEREAKKLRELQAAAAASNAEGGEADGGEPMETDEDKSIADSRSVFVGNVSTTFRSQWIWGSQNQCIFCVWTG